MSWTNEQKMTEAHWPSGNISCPSYGKMLDERPMYQLNGVRHCSWRCLRQAEQEYKESPEYRNILMELNGMEGQEPISLRKEFTRTEVQRIRALAAQGRTVSEIAMECRRGAETVRRKMHELGIIAHRQGVLTDAQKAEVRTMYRHGSRMRELALEYNVSISTISKVVKSA